MCGIAGIFDTKQCRPLDRGVLERMTHSLSHRGPDEFGLHMEDGVAFGHRRLSIIDLAAGQQPFESHNGRAVMVFNGEIYNFMDIRRELEGLGHPFFTRSDTEVLINAWLEWGPDCVKKLRGMFAFVVYDRRDKTLFMARDRVGIKPLYYAFLPNGELVFGSEMKALLQHPALKRKVRIDAVEDYFSYGYVPDPKTILEGVRKLPPGYHMLVRIGQGEVAPVQYWDLDFSAQTPGTAEDIGHELIERLREAVNIRLVADVPLGAFLSGGVDSSAVVAMMAGLNSEPVNTCSIGFEQKDHDESGYAQQIAEQYKTNHFVRTVDPGDFDLVDKLAGFYDEPYADSSAIPTYRVCELARERVTVALSGDGGDELFGGYRRYRWHDNEESIRSKLPLGLRRPVFGALGRLYPKMDWAPRLLRAKSTLQSLSLSSTEAYFHSVSTLPDDMRGQLYSNEMQRQLNGYNAVEVLQGFMEKAPADNHLSRVQYGDFKTYLPGDILTKVDRASMAHSLEVRVPILDHKFIEWATCIPSAECLRSGEGKYIFKKALESYLPKDILYRPKMGFAVPIGSWFRGPLQDRVRQALDSEHLLDSGMFDRAYLRKMLDNHVSGISDNGTALWSVLMFESSMRQILDGADSKDGMILSEKGQHHGGQADAGSVAC